MRQPIRAFAATAFLAGLLWLLLDPPSLQGLEGFVRIVAGATAIAVVAAFAITRFTADEIPEPQFRRIVDRSEQLAAMPAPDRAPSEFDEFVIDAIDELPDEFQTALERIPVVVSRRGHEEHAYGHYLGAGIARDGYPSRIVIYEDTLTRDFGHDPELLRHQVKRTVRHEIAHHLGWDEPGVRGLGL